MQALVRIIRRDESTSVSLSARSFVAICTAAIALMVCAAARADQESPRAPTTKAAKKKPALHFVTHVTSEGEPPRAASEKRIDARTVVALPRRSGDDLLRLVPGLLVSRHGAEGKGVQIFLRGFDAAHGSDLEVTVAGLPINEASNVHGHGYLDLGFIVPEVVREIDVRKGSFSADQGPFATAGSLRFDLGVPAELRGSRLTYEMGSTFRQRLLALFAPRGSPDETFFTVEAMADNGYGQNRAARRIVALGQVRLPLPASRFSLTALGTGYAATFGGPSPLPLSDLTAGRASFYDSYTKDTGGNSQRVFGGLRLRYAGDRSNLDALAFVQWRRLALRENFTGSLLFADQGDTKLQFHQSQGGGVRLRYDARLFRETMLRLGLDWRAESIAQHEDQLDRRGESFLRNRDLAALQQFLALHGVIELHPVSFLRLYGGARFDLFMFRVQDLLAKSDVHSQSLQAFSPRLSATFLLPRAVSLFAAYGRGVRPPEARSIVGTSNTEHTQLGEYNGKSLTLTQSDTVELGLRARAPRGVTLSAAGFGTWIDHEVLFDHVAAINIALNSTRRLGAELSISVEPLRWLKLQLDATYTDARFVDSSGPVPGVPWFLGTLSGIVWNLRGVSAGLRFTYLSPRPLRYGAIAGGAAILDLNVSYRWRFVEVGVQFDNMLAQQWHEGEFHYASWFDRSRPRSEIPSIHISAGPPFMARAALTFWLDGQGPTQRPAQAAPRP